MTRRAHRQRDPGGRRARVAVWLELCLFTVVALCQVPIGAQSGCDDVRRALDRGAYALAERQARECEARLSGQLGSGAVETDRALDLLVESLLKNGKAGNPDTLSLAKQVVASKARRDPPDSLDIAVSLQNLGAVHAERGEITLALPLHTEAHSLRLKALGPDAPAVADSLDHLAYSYMRLERRDDARTALDRALAIREANAERAPLALARTLTLAAVRRRYAEEYDAAVALVERALALRRRHSPDHPETASALHVKGDILFLQADFRAAHRAYLDALAVGERTLGPDHPAVAQYLRKVAVAESALGNVAEAKRLRERAFRIGEATLSECQPELPGFMNDLALSYKDLGDFAEARRLYQRALAIDERCLGPNHSLTVTIVHNLAGLATNLGDFAEAERLHMRTIRTWSANLGATHSYVLRGMDALAGVVEARGQRSRARALYEQVLATRRKANGPNHPEVAWTLTNIARLKLESGSLTAALHDITQAIDIYKRAGFHDEPDHFARALALRGTIEARLGRSEAARATLAESLAARERIFGAQHPLVAEARARLASADFALGSYPSALTAALEAERVGREHLQFTVRYLPERQGLAYADKRPKGLDTGLSVVAAGQTGEAPAVLDNLIQSRSLILDELAARARAPVAADPALASLSTALVASRQRFANLMVRSLGATEKVERSMLEEARRQKEEAELALADRSAKVRAELAQANVRLDDVRRALPPHAALVSIARYDRALVAKAAGVGAMRTVPSYIAFVIRHGAADVSVVPLGAAATVDALVAAWRQETTGILRSGSPADAEKAYRAAGARLRQQIWEPLRPHIKDTATVLVVPDGTLNLVALAALPFGQTSYLIDQAPVIHYLSAERDLVQSDTTSIAAGGLLAVGGAAFDDATLFARSSRPRGPRTAASAGAPATRAAASVTSCASWQSLNFGPLAGSLREVRAIARLWTDTSLILADKNASEREFKQAAAGRRVLHLATHGFFLGSTCAPASIGTRSVGGLATAGATPKLNENPLLLSGLALAGANRRAAAGPEDEDGILTAEEVAALNLRGVEWAVLSACDTGLGEVKAGEGVLGLRRAFQVAGVRTVIMSLWSVDDDATRVWMSALYRNRLQKRLSTADAVREAGLTVLNERRAKQQSTHPFYWAAFVAAGDWR